MDVKIIIDGTAVQIPAGQNLLAACLAAQYDIPYFCWHPALGSVGSCRQCAVKRFSGPVDTKGHIVMACMTEPSPGMCISLTDPDVLKFRDFVVESVLTNHPHDCPVCEVGGECHLQDMTVLTGHHARRTRFAKRTHLNQNLGPFIRHEMNRCIGCYRCVRFYQNVAGGDDFGVFGANRNIYFGRAADGALDSDFAGNLVEICPTGVFVDKPFSAHFRRKWDMRATPSICPHCAVGCNITVNEREGKFRRVVNRFNASLNGHFLCDRGRFGTGFVRSNTRLRLSRDRAVGTMPHTVSASRLAALLSGGTNIGIGSPRASLEANFALRQLVGPANFYAGLSDFEAASLAAALDIIRLIQPAKMRQIAEADAVLVLGDDPAIVAPILALGLREAATRPVAEVLAARGIPAWDDTAARQASGAPPRPFMVVTQHPTWLDKIATLSARKSPPEATALAKAICRQIHGAEPLSGPASDLLAAKRPLVVAGGDPAILRAAANIVLALRRAGITAQLSLLLPDSNSAGLGLLDCRPLSAAPAAGKTVLLLECDALRRVTGASLFAHAKAIAVLDHIETTSTARADLALAVGSFADSDGHFINLEGRMQRFHKAIFGNDDPPQSWALLRDAGIEAHLLAPGTWETHSALLDDIARTMPELRGWLPAKSAEGTARAAALPHRSSGRTAAHADIDVREPAPPRHYDSQLSTTMEGPPIHAQTEIRPVLWSPGWYSGQAVEKFPNSASGVDHFIFSGVPKRWADFEIPPCQTLDDRQLGQDDLSARSAAIIARRT